MATQSSYGGYTPIEETRSQRNIQGYNPDGTPIYKGVDPRQVGKYSDFGRDVPFNPALQRGEGLSEGFGQQYGGAFQQQQGLFDQYGRMAAGQGPSLAQDQLQRGLGEGRAMATQAALSARGGNSAGGQFAAAGVAANMGGQAAMNAAALRQQEQMMAMGAQGQLAGQMAGQSLQGQLGMEQLYQGALGQQLDANMAAKQQRLDERSAQIERAKATKSMFIPDLSSDENLKQDIIGTDNATQQAQQGKTGAQTASGILGALGGTLGKVAPLVALSDENSKKHIAPGNLQASQAVGDMGSYEFEYKAGYGQPAGRRFGVMAQEMERVYPQAVIDTPQGKGIDVAQGLGLNLAATSEQERRLRMLEQQMGVAGGQRQQGVFGGRA